MRNKIVVTDINAFASTLYYFANTLYYFANTLCNRTKN
jgi:hypothetical protein